MEINEDVLKPVRDNLEQSPLGTITTLFDITSSTIEAAETPHIKSEVENIILGITNEIRYQVGVRSMRWRVPPRIMNNFN
jgi:hypothetical protein